MKQALSKAIYLTPQIEVLEVDTESGFATSVISSSAGNYEEDNSFEL